MKALVVFYSRTGNTALIAKKIAALLGADVEEILSETAYDGTWGFLRGVIHSLRDRQVSIAAATAAPANYDFVVVGGPVWAGRVACPVRAFLRQHRSELNNTAFFVTQGSPSPASSLQQMEAVSGKHPIATLSISEREISNGSYDGLVRNFVDLIRAAAPTVAAKAA